MRKPSFPTLLLKPSSTLTSLVTRLVDPDEGRLVLDGTDLRDLAHGELARHVALVPQSAWRSAKRRRWPGGSDPRRIASRMVA